MSKLQALPGVPGWECWTVTEWTPARVSWHGRPVGAPIAVASADSVPALAAAAVAWLERPQYEIDDAVARLRRQLDSTPEKYAHQRRHIEARIDTELVAIRSR
jgi:hypothetical protein